MTGHEVYFSIVKAVQDGNMQEPFTKSDFRRACPGFAEGTYERFLRKHARGNLRNTELFDQVARDKFKLIRPLKYGARE